MLKISVKSPSSFPIYMMPSVIFNEERKPFVKDRHTETYRNRNRLRDRFTRQPLGIHGF